MLGAKSMMIDFVQDVGQCFLGAVNSSAKSVMERRGAGRIGHLHCIMLWLQERVDSGEMRTENERGSTTRQTSARRRRLQQQYEHFLKTLKVKWLDGRHPLASSAALQL